MDTIAIVDFGGQYTHLIANRIRRLGVYSEIIQPDADMGLYRNFKGIILSGSPYSVLDKESPKIDKDMLSFSIPILGLCYGHQLITQLLGGKLSQGKTREYGLAELIITVENPLLKGLSPSQQIWMSHGDSVEVLPDGFTCYGVTSDCPSAAIGNESKHIYGLQFHPEVTDTPNGMKILENFITICECKRMWNSQEYLKNIETSIKQQCKDKKVFLFVSGGVDSTVAFSILNNALGVQNVLGLHIDNGLMRYKESDEILRTMKKNGYNNLHVYDASSLFLDSLKNIYDPEKKRAIIGKQFVNVKKLALDNLGLKEDEWVLAQGTIYPDTIESAGTKHADKIKTHHNRVESILELLEKGLVIEPLAMLYKDEVRQLGEYLEISKELLMRHPFPGPGLGVRILCSNGSEVSPDTALCDVVEKYAEKEGYSSYILPLKSVGVQGDSRTYAHPALLAGTQDWKKLEFLSTEITNSVKGVNRILFGLNVGTDPEYRLVKSYITRDRIEKLQHIDYYVTTALMESGEYNSVWQMPVVLLPLLNKRGDECVVLRPIASQEAMTARFVPLMDETLNKIVAKAQTIDGIGDVFFDITHKPPGTIEWE